MSIWHVAFLVWYFLVALSVYRFTEGIIEGGGELSGVWPWFIFIALGWPITLSGAGVVFLLAIVGAPRRRQK